jgi:hypothetical protein
MGFGISLRSSRFASAWLVGATLCCASFWSCSSGQDGEPLSSAGAAVCRDGDPDRERWGTSCLCCHTHDFGVAGSIAPSSQVVDIFVEDRDGRTAEMSPDIFDNFFRHRKLTPPLVATVTFADGDRRVMREVPHGSCNACHGVEVPLVGVR